MVQAAQLQYGYARTIGQIGNRARTQWSKLPNCPGVTILRIAAEPTFSRSRNRGCPLRFSCLNEQLVERRLIGARNKDGWNFVRSQDVRDELFGQFLTDHIAPAFRTANEFELRQPRSEEQTSELQ